MYLHDSNVCLRCPARLNLNIQPVGTNLHCHSLNSLSNLFMFSKKELFWRRGWWIVC